MEQSRNPVVQIVASDGTNPTEPGGATRHRHYSRSRHQVYCRLKGPALSDGACVASAPTTLTARTRGQHQRISCASADLPTGLTPISQAVTLRPGFCAVPDPPTDSHERAEALTTAHPWKDLAMQIADGQPVGADERNPR